MASEESGLTIITVVKNDKEGLLRTCGTVHRQQGIKIIHIIVDGGSDDGSEIIARTQSDVILDSYTDGGIYRGMQRGADVVTSKYLMFLNSGDELLGTSTLSKVFRKLEEAKAQWGFGPVIEHSTRDTFILTDTSGSRELKNISWRKTFVPFPSTLLKRTFFQELGGFSFDYQIAGDFDLLVRATKASSPIYWIEPLVLFQAGGVSYLKAPLGWNEEHQVRINSLSMSAILTFQSALTIRQRKMKWYVGKCLDIVQAAILPGKTHWRDRRGHVLSSEQVSKISP